MLTYVVGVPALNFPFENMARQMLMVKVSGDGYCYIVLEQIVSRRVGLLIVSALAMF